MSRWFSERSGEARGWSLAVVIAAVALVSFLAGRYAAPSAPAASAPSRQVQQDRGVPIGSPVAHAEPAPCAEPGPLAKRLIDLEARYRALALVTAVGLGAPARVAASGKALPPPLPFPEELPPAQTPRHFKEAATSILQKCMPTMAVQDADCSEYPCIAWASFDASIKNRFDVTECDDWSRTMGKKTAVVVQLAPDGATGFYGVFSLPEDKAAVARANARADLRIKALAESYGIVAP